METLPSIYTLFNIHEDVDVDRYAEEEAIHLHINVREWDLHEDSQLTLQNVCKHFYSIIKKKNWIGWRAWRYFLKCVSLINMHEK